MFLNFCLSVCSNLRNGLTDFDSTYTGSVRYDCSAKLSKQKKKTTEKLSKSKGTNHKFVKIEIK